MAGLSSSLGNSPILPAGRSPIILSFAFDTQQARRSEGRAVAMSAVEIIIWSLALGAIGAVALARLVDLAIHPAMSIVRSAAFHFTVLALVAVLSGLLDVLEPLSDPDVLEAAQVMAGP